MGLDTRLVLSDERHHGPFLCVVCRDLTGLADALVSTAGCDHVFCRRCLEAWLGRESDAGRPGGAGVVDMFGPPPHPRCPACNADLSYGSSSSSSKRPRSSSPGNMTIAGRSVLVEPLKEGQPLAHRILRRVRVGCPLAERHGCPWEGDYGDLHSHLVSESAHRDDGGEGVAAQIGTAASAVESELEMEIDGPAMTVGASLSDTMGDSSGDAAAAMAASSRRRALAASFKEEANTKFASGDHKDASDLYGKSLSVLLPPETAVEGLDDGDRSLAAALYCNRAAARLQIGDWEGSLLDSGNAIALDLTYAKAHVRKSRALVELGRFEEAKDALEEGWEMLKGEPATNATASSAAASSFKAVSVEMKRVQRICKLASEGQEQLRVGRYAAAKATYGSLLRETTALRAMIGAARSDLGIGRSDAALRLSLRILRADGRSSEGLEIRGAALYLSGDFSQSATVLREALRLDPDHVRAKDVIRRCRSVERSVKGARSAVFRRDFDQAVGLYTEAMEASDPLPHEAPLYGLLHAERGEAYVRLKKYQEAAKDAALAIYARDDDAKAWMVKVRAYHGLGRHEEARDELGDLMTKWGAGNDMIRKAYDKADFEVRRLHRPNFYELLGVPSIASEMEIKKQYKAKALELHPDRLSGQEFSDKDRKDAEEKFKLIGEGLEILCDDFKRQLYDEGYDQDAIRERVAAAQQAAHRQGRDYHRH